ncbi:MAG TPA: pitrilysin family protein [Vicinamibacterales bacterium]|nr:pitrilysin family protein [Vicinamibacterales bacterium]
MKALSAEPGLSPVRRTLANGLAALVQRTATHPAVTLAVALPAGAICDPEDRLGLATFASRVIDRGTVSRDSVEIAEMLDARGVSLNAGVSRHLFVLNCSCLSEDAPALLDLLAEVVMTPVFPPNEVETRRAELITAIRQDDDNPASAASDAMSELLFPGHPYGRRQRGTVASVQNITRQDLVEFHRQRFGPAGATVVVVGDIDPERAADLVERSFEGWRASVAPPPDVPPPPTPGERRQAVIPMMDKAQADIAYGVLGVRRQDPQYSAALLMNNVLGQYGLGGRLGDSLRERQGMAYYAYSSLDAELGAGALTVRAGVAGENVERALESIDAELTRMQREGVTPGELTDAKRYLTGSMPRLLETNDGIATFLLTVEHFGLGLDYDRRLPGLLEAVTLDEVNAAAATLLRPDRAAVAIAGPYRETRAA